MSPQDDFSLVGGGDCFSHFHSEDRVPSRDFYEGLQTLARVKASSGPYTVSAKDDYHLISAASPVVATLPKARNSRLFTFVRVSGAATVTLTPAAGETINGAATLVISTTYSPVRILAMDGVGYVQV